MWPMKQLMIILSACLLLSGCLTLNETISTGAAAGAAGVTSLVTANPAAIVVTSAGAGLAAGLATEEPKAPEIDVTQCQTDECYAAFEAHERQVLIMDIWHWLVGGAVALLLGLYLIGRFTPSPREKRLMRKAFNCPNTTTDDI